MATKTAETAVTAEEKETKTAETAAKTEKTKTAGERKWLIKITANPSFCGIGAGGIQFANGKAVTENGRMAQWFREHNGYEVSEQ